MQQKNPVQTDLELEAKIIKSIQMLSEIYSHRMSEDAAHFYYTTLAECERNDLLEAILSYPKTLEAKYFPKPFELIEICNRIRRKRENKILDENRRELQIAYKRN